MTLAFTCCRLPSSRQSSQILLDPAQAPEFQQGPMTIIHTNATWVLHNSPLTEFSSVTTAAKANSMGP